MLGAVQKGRLNCLIGIDSAPESSPPEFWSGFASACRRNGFHQADISTAGTACVVPSIGTEVSRRNRIEYLLPLAGADIERGMRENHRRNRKKAFKAGVQVRQTSEVAALDTHIALIRSSMHRRLERGERVPDGHDRDFEACLLGTGAGRLFQAAAGEVVLSSVLVIDAAEGAYYRSAGNSPEAMNCGASVMLLSEIALQLQAEGKSVFNFGGADEGSSLAAFKLGFGTQPQYSQAAAFYVGSGFRRILTAVAGKAIAFTGDSFRAVMHRS
jgi:hypothetical protein